MAAWAGFLEAQAPYTAIEIPALVRREKLLRQERCNITSPRLGRRFLNWSKAEQETQGFESNFWMCFRPGLCAGAVKRRLTTVDTLSGDGEQHY